MRYRFNLLLALGLALGCTTAPTMAPVNRGDVPATPADVEEAGTSCPLAGFRLCAGVCVNGATDPLNCGACGRACASTEVCLDGACALNCGPLTRCFEAGGADGGAADGASDGPAPADGGGAGRTAVCADLMTSARHCGGCNQPCAEGQVCRGGMCAPRGCPTGLTECMVAVPVAPADGGLDGGGDASADAGEVATRLEARCLDTQSHAEHCGGCGMACAFGQRCREGRCEAYCPAGTSMCGASGCTALQLDPANCGSCGRACPAASVCVDGQCSLTCGPLTRCTRTPDGGAPDAGADGGAPMDYCADTQSDPGNCGRCGNACAGHERCEAGACRLRCPASQIECSGQCVDPRTDGRNCGGCGRACAAGQACAADADGGMPTCVATCAAPFSACLPDGGTPYCANFQVDPANCGSCGRACPAGQVCVSGMCTLPCATGQLACPAGAPIACVDPRFDPVNCGACGRMCDASQSCAGGSCCALAPTAAAASRSCQGGGAGCTSSFVLRNGQSAAQGFSVGATGGFLVRARLHVSNPHAPFGRAARVYVVQGTSNTSLADAAFNFDRDAIASAPLLGGTTAGWAEVPFAPPVRMEAGRNYFLVLRLPDFPVSPCPAPCIARDATCDCPAVTWTLTDDNSSPSADPFPGGFAFSCGATCPSFIQEPARRDQVFEVYISTACGT